MSVDEKLNSLKPAETESCSCFLTFDFLRYFLNLQVIK
jgi:hypothetical protein